jgi:hypothetical protein
MVRITAPDAAGAKMLVQDLLGVLAVIEDWLDDAGVEAVRVKDGQRTYHMERPAHAGDRQ